MNLIAAINQLKQEVQTKTSEIDQINRAIKLLQGSAIIQKTKGRRRGHHMSPQSIEKIRASQKARWAAIKGSTSKKKTRLGNKS